MSTTTKPQGAGVNPDIRPDDLPPVQLNSVARTILPKRYLKKNEQGEAIESPEDMFWRVAATIAQVDAEYGAKPAEVEERARTFYRLMSQGYFEPNSPTLMNAGRPLGQLSACFVLPVEDAMSNGEDGIYDTLRSMALVHQSGGGTGFSFSRLRPEDDVVKSTMGVASGPVSFMKLYDASTEVVKQGGTRRGANMGILRVDHPDIRKFITCKSDTSEITNFNISVAVTNAFMDAVREDEVYELVNPRTKEVVGHESAREIFDLIIDGAWATGEPGLLFIDRANEYNPVPHLGNYEASNPCGEQILLPNDVCNLGSINLGKFVDLDADPNSPVIERVDWDGMAKVTREGVRFLDNVIDANQFPLPAIRDLAQNIRRIGFGIMGWADMLVRLGIPYGSEEATEFALKVSEFLRVEQEKASMELADERGPFPEWEKSTWGPGDTCARRADGSRVHPMKRLRNCNINTIAPTGTISIIANCSGGLEPLFAVAFMRNQAGEMMPDVNEDFIRIAKEQGWHSDALMERIAEEGHIHFDEVPEEVQRVFQTSHDIAPEWHVRMQAAWQENIHSSISKTTNFPKEASKDDVREIYELAYELGCKGVTVYRDGSRPEQVLSTGKTADPEKEKELNAEIEALEGKLQASEDERAKLAASMKKNRKARPRPAMLSGRTMRQMSPLGDLYVTVNEDEDGSAFEIFATLGKSGGAAMADSEAIGRLASLALRSGVPLQEIYDQLRGISCDRAVGFGDNKVLSMPDGIAQAIGRYLRAKEGTQEELDLGLPGMSPSTHQTPVLETCPECGSSHLVRESGCNVCKLCGHSACN